MRVDYAPDSGGPKLSCIERVYGCYIKVLQVVSSVFSYLRLDFVWDPVVTFLTEPVTFFESGYLYSQGGGSPREFTPYGLNPQDVSAVDIQNVAILLIHGAASNQGLWRPLAKRLQRANLHMPVFTVNVPTPGYLCGYPHQIRQQEVDCVKARIEEIKEVHQKANKPFQHLIIIGHSRGGDIGEKVCGEVPEVSKVIRLGKMTRKEEFDPANSFKLFEIRAMFDAVCPWGSVLPENQHTSIRTGHLGLIYSRSVHNKIIELITDRQ